MFGAMQVVKVVLLEVFPNPCIIEVIYYNYNLLGKYCIEVFKGKPKPSKLLRVCFEFDNGVL